MKDYEKSKLNLKVKFYFILQIIKLFLIKLGVIQSHMVKR